MADTSKAPDPSPERNLRYIQVVITLRDEDGEDYKQFGEVKIFALVLDDKPDGHHVFVVSDRSCLMGDEVKLVAAIADAVKLFQEAANPKHKPIAGLGQKNGGENKNKGAT